MSGTRRPLGPGVITLIAVDVVLVLILLVLLAQAGSNGGTTATSPASPTTPADAPTAEEVVFASPTRNITCFIRPESASCEIAQFMYETPTLDGCDGDVGHEIEVTADGAGWVCRTGEPPPPPAPEVPNLDWGDSISRYGFTCMSTNDGVTCTHDATGHSFSLARRVVSLS